MAGPRSGRREEAWPLHYSYACLVSYLSAPSPRPPRPPRSPHQPASPCHFALFRTYCEVRGGGRVERWRGGGFRTPHLHLRNPPKYFFILFFFTVSHINPRRAPFHCTLSVAGSHLTHIQGNRKDLRSSPHDGETFPLHLSV